MEKNCKWCNSPIINKRSDALFCKRSCKNIYRRKKKIENERSNR